MRRKYKIGFFNLVMSIILFPQCKFVSVLVSLMRQMTERHFLSFLNCFQNQDELYNFLVELIMVIQDLISQPVFPSDWAEMILLQNRWVFMYLKYTLASAPTSTCTSTFAFIHIHIHINIHIHIHPSVCPFIHACVYIYVYVCVNM